MAIAKPFTSVRPASDKAHLIASRPVTGYTADQLREKLSTNPYSFLHIINPDYALAEAEQSNSKARFVKVKARFGDFMRDGILERDASPAYFLYRQSGPNGSFTGIIAGVSCQDYWDDAIKKHEQTLSKREGLFVDYLDFTDFNAEPVLLSYPDNPQLAVIFNAVAAAPAANDFSTSDKVRHTLWPITDTRTMAQIESLFADVPSFYIADGHHRSASSALLMNKRKNQNPEHTGQEPYNFFMAMLLPESQLKIFPFHRVVKDLNGMSDDEFLQQAASGFDISVLSGPQKPERGQILFFTSNTSALLTAKNYDISPGNIDAQMLTDRLLAPLLGISDLRTDKRVDFVGGPDAFDQMTVAVLSQRFRAGFALSSCVPEDITYTADHGLTMPPKSTWIEPKLRSGLTIYELK